MTSARLSFIALFALACSSGPVSVGDDRRGDAGSGAAGAGSEAGASVGGASGEAGTSAEAGAGAEAGSSSLPTAAELLALLEPCTMISNGLLAREIDREKDVPVCGFGSAVYWTSQLSVDCDGKRGPICNADTDPQSSANTDGKASDGTSLDPVAVPYVEVPVASATFDYQAAGLRMGSVVAVIYKGRVVYGVLGNEQRADVIGAASYAMADLLGINPDPVKGGIQTKDVTYLAFSGASHVVPALEDVAAAAALGQNSARELVKAGR